jgi:hypothetical protein
MSEQQCQCAVLILTQSAERVDFKSSHTLNCACIKSNEVSNHTIIEELINQLQHVYNNSESRERATHILKALKQKEKSFEDI